MYGFALKGKWLVATIAVALIAFTFVNLGLWQLRRLDWRRENNIRILTRRELPPTSLQEHIGEPASEIEYRRVTAKGVYDTQDELILFGRPNPDGLQGSHVLTPLVTPDGSTIIVDRGWVPLSMAEPPIADSLPPEGKVNVSGILLPPESEGGTDPPAGGKIKGVDLDQISAALGRSVMPVFLMLNLQDPPQPGEYPVPAEIPELTEGSHFSYALQWFLFTVIGLVGYGALVRREAIDRKKRAGRPMADLEELQAAD